MTVDGRRCAARSRRVTPRRLKLKLDRTALLDEGGDLRVAGRAERARLAERDEAAIVVEAVAAASARIGSSIVRIARAQA